MFYSFITLTSSCLLCNFTVFEFPSDIQIDTPYMSYGVYEQFQVAQNPFKPSNSTCWWWCPQSHCSCWLVLYSWLELWNPPFIVRGWGPAVTDRKDCRVAKFPSKSPASLHLLGSFWVEVCLSVTLGTTQKAVPHLCQPVSAIPSRTSAGLLLATCSHSSWFLRWCPISVRDWFTPVAPLKALANHTLEKPHLRYFSMSCTAVRHKGTRTGWAFSSFSPDCSAAVKRITAPHPKGCWTFSCQALSISKDGGFDTLSEQPFEWLSSYFHVPVTVIHSLVLQPC